MSRVTWEAVEGLNVSLASQINEAELAPNLIVAVARGGFVPARLLASALEIRRLTSIGISYTGADRRERELYATPTPIRSTDRILLVEDALESGRSLVDARDLLNKHGASVWTVSYYYSAASLVVPDFSLGAVDQVPQFPWE